MDNLTHTLIGVTAANAGLKDRFGRGTTLALAVASNIPDLDVFGHWFHPGPSFLYRRMFTHSLLALPFLSAGFAALYRRAYPNLTFRGAWFLWAFAMVLHVLFDLVNSYGVVLFYPLSHRRFELASVFIIDLALWAMMLAPLLLFRWVTLRAASRVAAAAVVAYVVACVALRGASTWALHRYEIQAGLNPRFSYVFPEPFGPERFRGVVRQDDIYRVYQIHPFTLGVSKFDELRTQDGQPSAKRILDSDFGRKLAWFAKAPVLRQTAITPAGAERWAFFDLRFGSTVLKRRNFFSYGFEVTPDAVTPVGRVADGTR
jgi:inner membrane protein